MGDPAGQKWDTTVANQIDLRDDVAREIPALQKRPRSDLAIIRDALEKQEPVAPAQIEQGSWELKRLAEHLDLCRIHQDHLQYRVIVNKRPLWVTICPPSMRNLVIQKVHTQHHSGINKTYRRIKRDWFWPGMTRIGSTR